MRNPDVRTAAEKDSINEQLVDALNAIFGSHAGYRPLHAKGIVCEGTFAPSGRAAWLTRAPHLQSEPSPVTVRFSDFSGVPSVPDGDPTASPRGMAIRFHLPSRASTDLIAHSYRGFPAATPEEFLTFLRALASSGPDAPKPTALEKFLATHPQAKLFAMAPKPTPASFATEAYYAVDAFRFTNRDGASRYGRYRIIPDGGAKHLDTVEAARRPASFLFDELADRLSQGPIKFYIAVQLAEEGDTIEDPSLPWPDERPQVEFGVLTVTARVADSAAVEQKLDFDPSRLVDGIELSGDPILLVRSAVYAIARRRRLAGVAAPEGVARGA
ncbi:MAG: catalase family peroxidase [Bradyrhizobium sp.]